MKGSARFSMYAGAVFAALCFGVAITGFTSLGGITDPVQLADAKGFAGFWAFLGITCTALAFASWWVSRPEKAEPG